MQSGQGYEVVVGSCEHGIGFSDFLKLGKYFINYLAINSQRKTVVYRYSQSISQSAS
jgi:hypothetical protein